MPFAYNIDKCIKCITWFSVSCAKQWFYLCYRLGVGESYFYQFLPIEKICVCHLWEQAWLRIRRLIIYIVACSGVWGIHGVLVQWSSVVILLNMTEKFNFLLSTLNYVSCKSVWWLEYWPITVTLGRTWSWIANAGITGLIYCK